MFLQYAIVAGGKVLFKKLAERYGVFNYWFAYMLVFMNVIASCATNVYISCINDVMYEFSITASTVQLTIVSHLIGEFVSRMAGGVLCDVYGKRITLLGSLFVSVLGNLLCFFAADVYQFIVARLIQALGSGVIYIISVGIINDWYCDSRKGRVISVLEMASPLAWMISPFIGVYASKCAGWQYSFLWFVIAQSVMALIVYWKFFEISTFSHKVVNVYEICCSYKDLACDALFMLYALIPGLMMGLYMLYASCIHSIFSAIPNFIVSDRFVIWARAIPLIFYIIFSYVYRYVLRKFGVRIARLIGIAFCMIFSAGMGYYICYDVCGSQAASYIIVLMCIECCASAFLLPVAILKALEFSSQYSGICASMVAVLRNLIIAGAIFFGSLVKSPLVLMLSIAIFVLWLFGVRKLILIK